METHITNTPNFTKKVEGLTQGSIIVVGYNADHGEYVTLWAGCVGSDPYTMNYNENEMMEEYGFTEGELRKIRVSFRNYYLNVLQEATKF